MGFLKANEGMNSLKKQADALESAYATQELNFGDHLHLLLDSLKDSVSPSQMSAIIAQIPTIAGVWPNYPIRYDKVNAVCETYQKYVEEKQQELADVNAHQL